MLQIVGEMKKTEHFTLDLVFVRYTVQVQKIEPVP